MATNEDVALPVAKRTIKTPLLEYDEPTVSSCVARSTVTFVPAAGVFGLTVSFFLLHQLHWH